ncbi:MAG TPA: CaiB/BaiF CoA-transferase family protein, partial [Streptomyces sp.]|nr:CaiB/BaiF CoA-transferase family protein [Streptomyces sp.]
ANTGVARAVEVSLFEALAEWMGQPAYYTGHSGTQPPRIGTQHPTIAPYGAYTAADGKDVLFSIQNEREWAALCSEFLEQPDVADDPRFATSSARVANREALNTLVAERFARSGGAQIIEVLDRIGIAYAEVNSMADFLQHPVLSGRDRWREVGVPGASVQALLPPVDLAGTSARMDPVPDVGEHTDTILAELGHTADAVEALRAADVI